MSEHGRSSDRSASLAYAGEIAAITIVYVLIAKLSLSFASINPSASPIWPPAGLALGVILLRGYRVWPAIFLGALITNATTAGSLATSAVIGVGNTLEAVVGAAALNFWAQGRRAFETPWGVAKFAGVAALAGTPISATVGVLALSIGGFAPWASFTSIWTTWWLGDVAGVVVIAPVVVLWAGLGWPPRWRSDGVGAWISLLLLAAAVGLAAYSPFERTVHASRALAFLALLPLMWAALRGARRQTATLAMLLSGFAVWGVMEHAGPFIQATLNDSFLLLIAFMVSITLPSLALSAALDVRTRALAASEESYRLLVDGVRDHAMFLLDREGRVTQWNSGAQRITGYSPEDIIGESVSRFHTPEDLQSGEPSQALATAASAGRYEADVWRLRKDGTRFRANVVINPIRDAEGALVGFAKITRDISERHEAQSKLEATREQLFQSQKMDAIGKLTGGIAHDFNNALAIVIGNLDLLLRRLPGDPEKARALAGNALEGARRAAALTQRLLAFSRQQALDPKPIDVNACIVNLSRLLGGALGETVSIRTVLAGDLWPATLDRGQFESALLNLAVNARDAMPEGGELTIQTSNRRLDGASATADGAAGDYVSVAVRDTGLGMTEDTRTRAFDPFFTTKPAGKGTGLGLSQVHGFITQSGGRMELDSRPGGGATVTLYLPRAQSGPAMAAPAQTAAADRPDAAGAGPVLLVEDDAAVRDFACAALREIGYRVYAADRVAAGLELLDRHPEIGLILTDVVMPEADGRALADAAHRRRPDLPVVFMTGYASGLFEGRKLESDALLILKPFTAEQLAAKLAEALVRAPAVPSRPRPDAGVGVS